MQTDALFRRLRRSRDGSVVVEFALTAPIFFMLLFGVLQIGVAMWNYNALRGIAGEVSRWTVVQYQSNNQIANSQIQAKAQAVAIQAPFSLQQGRLGTTVTDAASQRVSGAKEITLSLTYRVPGLVPFAGIDEIDIKLDRSIFLLQ